MGEKKDLKKSKLFGKKGFYATLIVLSCIVVGTAVYMSQNNSRIANKTNQNLASVTQSPAKGTDPLLTKNKVDTVMTAALKAKSIKDVKAAIAKSKKVTSKKSVSNKSTKVLHRVSFKLLYPVKGEVTKKFDNKELQYSKPMGQWETHEGIDFACVLGTTVKASIGGKVVDVIKNDTVLNPLIKNGDKVKVGQVIGKVGDTTLREAIDLEGSHLHFALLKKSGNNYAAVDPNQFLK